MPLRTFWVLRWVVGRKKSVRCWCLRRWLVVLDMVGCIHWISNMYNYNVLNMRK